MKYTTGTGTSTTRKYNYDDITNEFLEWVRDVPWESDAVANIPLILRRYDRQKTFWQRVKLLFS